MVVELIGFVARRLLTLLPVLWGATTLLFLIFFVLPGDRADAVLGGEHAPTAQQRAAVTHDLGLDQPISMQYLHYWDRLLHGDLGSSYISGRSVSEVLATTVPASVRLAFWALVAEVAAGFLFGAYTALSDTRLARISGILLSGCLIALPVFVIGYVLQLALSVVPAQHGFPDWLVFPAQGIGPDSWRLGVIPTGEQWRYLLMPALTLATASTVVIGRLLHTSLGKAMASSWVLGARARGVSGTRLALMHGLRNALVPVIAFVGLDIAALFGSAVVTESVFSWPGIGNQLAIALHRQDAPMMLGITIVLVVVYVLADLMVDVVHRSLDPRLGSKDVP